MGMVYLLCELSDNERFKIGTTKRDIYKRIKELSTGNSHEIHLVNKFESEYYRKIESWLHRRFVSYKTIDGGTEWFDLPVNEVVDFTKTCMEVEETIKYLMETNPFFK